MLQQAGLEWLTVENFGVFEEKGLGRAKLSMAKYESLLSAVAFFQASPIQWEALADDEVRAHLSGIKGVGKWTGDMILLYTLDRPCVFPADDFHLKQVMTDLYGLNANSKLKAQMLEVAQHWGNCQSLAVKYLLAWKEFQKKNRP